MPNKVRIAPSLLSADPLKLGEELQDIEKAGADLHHVDVMDGHFVPNLTYGPPLVKSLKKFCQLPLNVHIMVSNPDKVALDYVKAGADILTFHVEASQDPIALCNNIRAAGAQVGIALNPDTPLTKIEKYLPYVDQILVMSVFPGFGGQEFIKESTDKISKLSQMLKAKKLDKVIIEVDGGIHNKNIKEVVSAGATMIVAGSYIYKSPDRAAAIKSLR